MNKKVYILIILIGILSISFVNAETEYTVDVSLLNAYEDVESMGNNSLVPEGKLIVDGKSAKLRLTFVPLDIMDFKGYLGEIKVEGKAVNIISTYDVIDSYNDENSKDERMKGKVYPKTIEFPVDLKKDILNAVIYVPVMGELGYGDQNVRIKIKYPKIEKEIKYYQVPIKLWNANDDQESMGNGSMKNMANILMKDGKMTVYIGSDKMEVSSLVASLINIYYDNGKGYKKANAYSYTLKIDGDDNIRPEVFSFPLKTKKEYLDVLVDPKVDIMGEDPLKARIKFFFDEMEEIKKEEAELILKANENIDNRTIDYKFDKGFKLYTSFDNEVEFKATSLKGEELNTLSKKYPNMKKAYKLSALEIVDFIPYDKKLSDIRKSYQPSAKIKVLMPIKKEGQFLLYALDDESPIEYKKIGNNIEFTYDKLGTFILDYQEEKVIEKEEQKIPKEEDNIKKTDKIIINSSEKMIKKNSPTVIMLFIIIVIPLLIASIYFFNKYYKKLIRELLYAEELKIKLERRINK